MIYLPETAFDIDKFIDETKAVYQENGKVIVAVSEGAKTKEGRYIAEFSASSLSKDSFGHSQLGGTAQILANLIKNETGAKVRGIEFSLLQRCSSCSFINRRK